MAPMILVLGGTSDSLDVLRGLVEKGWPVMISMATDNPMEFPDSPLVTVRRGALDAPGMVRLMRRHDICALIDATHPYATEVTKNAKEASSIAGIPYFQFLRDATAEAMAHVIFASNHEDAACRAAKRGGVTLLTIGVKHLATYVSACSDPASQLIVRILPRHESLDLARRLGIPPEHTIVGRGPFTYADNVALIRRFGVKTLVTKDSGTRGGTQEKIRAARDEGCHVIVIQRPDMETASAFSDSRALVDHVDSYLHSMNLRPCLE